MIDLVVKTKDFSQIVINKVALQKIVTVKTMKQLRKE